MIKVYFDEVKCLGCHSCAFACAVEHSQSKDPLRAHREASQPATRRQILSAEGRLLSVVCRHCEAAACVEACIAGAMRKVDGRVECDLARCIGCWMCVMVCPFDAARPGELVVVKCDLCAGREGGPACVAACPTGALFEATPEEFRKRLEEMLAARRAEALK